MCSLWQSCLVRLYCWHTHTHTPTSQVGYRGFLKGSQARKIHLNFRSTWGHIFPSMCASPTETGLLIRQESLRVMHLSDQSEPPPTFSLTLTERKNRREGFSLSLSLPSLWLQKTDVKIVCGENAAMTGRLSSVDTLTNNHDASWFSKVCNASSTPEQMTIAEENIQRCFLVNFHVVILC